MKFNMPTSILALSSVAPLASAWTTTAHWATGVIASNLINPATSTYFSNFINIVDQSTWAESYRQVTPSAAKYFSIDAKDNPPSSCSVDMARDCKDGCIVTAINDYFNQVKDMSGKSDRFLAAKLLIGLVGNIHNPLQTESLGDSIAVNYNGTSTSLLNAWNDLIPRSLAKGYIIVIAKQWGQDLTTAIKTGQYATKKSTWTSSLNPKDILATSLAWAKESNALVCSTVMPNGPTALTTGDLSKAYFEKVGPVAQEQVAKAGYRLAALMEILATGSTEL